MSTVKTDISKKGHLGLIIQNNNDSDQIICNNVMIIDAWKHSHYFAGAAIY